MLGAHCQRLAAGGQWSKEKVQPCISVLEIKAAKLVIEDWKVVGKVQNEDMFEDVLEGAHGREEH